MAMVMWAQRLFMPPKGGQDLPGELLVREVSAETSGYVVSPELVHREFLENHALELGDYRNKDM